jgi:hypothetical protein
MGRRSSHLGGPCLARVNIPHCDIVGAKFGKIEPAVRVFNTVYPIMLNVNVNVPFVVGSPLATPGFLVEPQAPVPAIRALRFDEAIDHDMAPPSLAYIISTPLKLFTYFVVKLPCMSIFELHHNFDQRAARKTYKLC